MKMNPIELIKSLNKRNRNIATMMQEKEAVTYEVIDEPKSKSTTKKKKV